MMGGRNMRIVCGKPKVSAYNFMRYLCAALATEGKVIVDLSAIVSNIYKLKKSLIEETSKGAKYLFDDIEFRVGIDDSVASSDISEGLNSLQTFGLIGKLNPTYEKIVIYLTGEEAEDILKSCDNELADILKELAKSF